MRGAIERTFDQHPEEVASLLPTITAADHANPAARLAVVYRNDAGRHRFEWQVRLFRSPAFRPAG
jgi:hypothetical protein